MCSDLAALGVDARAGPSSPCRSITYDYFACWFWWHDVNVRRRAGAMSEEIMEEIRQIIDLLNIDLVSIDL